VFRLIVVSLLLFFLGLTTVVAQDVEVATSIAFTEGPTADAAGNMFFTDQANGLVISPDDKIFYEGTRR